MWRAIYGPLRTIPFLGPGRVVVQSCGATGTSARLGAQGTRALDLQVFGRLPPGSQKYTKIVLDLQNTGTPTNGLYAANTLHFKSLGHDFGRFEGPGRKLKDPTEHVTEGSEIAGSLSPREADQISLRSSCLCLASLLTARTLCCTVEASILMLQMQRKMLLRSLHYRARAEGHPNRPTCKTHPSASYEGASPNALHNAFECRPRYVAHDTVTVLDGVKRLPIQYYPCHIWSGG